MASSSDGGATSLSAPDNRSDISDDALSRSGSSYVGSDESNPAPSTCAWRTAEFHDQECSRYFDCPSHLVERSLSDSELSGGGGDAGPAGNRSQAQVESVHEHDPDERGPRQAMGSGATPSEPESERRTPVEGPSRSSDTPAVPSTSSADVPTSSQPREASAPNLNLPERTSSLRSSPSLPPNTSETPDQHPARDNSPTHRRRDSEARRAPELTQSPSSSQRRPSGPPRNFSDILLPRWQPDSEATFCPICRTQFSFFVRKHHCRFVVYSTQRPRPLLTTAKCRKCGRVVCNACSPHRITIPHQYIVRPPGQGRTSQPYSNPLMGDDGLPYVSGGERVRLCNPCVPDPNTTPPLSVTSPTQRSPRPHYRSQSNLGSGFGGFPSGARSGLFFQSPVHESCPRGRSITMVS